MKGWTSTCGTYSKRPGRPVSWNATKAYRLTERNVLERLPEKPRDWVKRQLRGTWRQETEKESLAAPRRLAAQLEKAYPGTAASLREGMEETVTVIRLGIPELLQGKLRSTNAIASAHEKVRMASRNAKRWQNGEQVLRWAAS